jgi:hypothetical protein
MTRHYARVFNGTLSPFHKDWQTAYQNDVLLKDDVLIALFEQFKVAEAYHCTFLPILFRDAIHWKSN